MLLVERVNKVYCDHVRVVEVFDQRIYHEIGHGAGKEIEVVEKEF